MHWQKCTVAHGHSYRYSPWPWTSLALLLWAAPVQAQVVIADQTFNDADWSSVVAGVTGNPTQTAAYSPAGGVSGSYRQMVHHMTSNSYISVAHLYAAATYSPASQGAVQSMSYQEFYRVTNPPFPGAAIGIAPAIRQSGTLYFGPAVAPADTVWTSHSLANLTAADFATLNGSGHPDFSAVGGLIEFGYARSNASGATYDVQHDIDNWSYQITPVPEPAGLLLAGCAATVGISRVARRTKHCSRRRGPDRFLGLPAHRGPRRC